MQIFLKKKTKKKNLLELKFTTLFFYFHKKSLTKRKKRKKKKKKGKEKRSLDSRGRTHQPLPAGQRVTWKHVPAPGHRPGPSPPPPCRILGCSRLCVARAQFLRTISRFAAVVVDGWWISGVIGGAAVAFV
jgi:hypothetical protein